MLGRIMRRVLRIFRTAFTSPVSYPEIRDHEQAKREIARDVVSKTPSGNVSLQQGRYLTKEDMDCGFVNRKRITELMTQATDSCDIDLYQDSLQHFAEAEGFIREAELRGP